MSNNFPVLEIILITGNSPDIYAEDLPTMTVFHDGRNYYFGSGLEYLQPVIAKALDSLSSSEIFSLTVAVDLRSGTDEDAARSLTAQNND